MHSIVVPTIRRDSIDVIHASFVASAYQRCMLLTSGGNCCSREEICGGDFVFLHPSLCVRVFGNCAFESSALRSAFALTPRLIDVSIEQRNSVTLPACSQNFDLHATVAI